MGQKVMKEFLNIHMDYPIKDLQSETQGTVKINFTTNESGKVTDYYIIQSVSAGIDSSALSIFKLILWAPAYSLGKPVIGKSEFKLKYNIKKFQKLSRRRGYKHIVYPVIPIDTTGTIYEIIKNDTVPKAILEPGVKSVTDLIYGKLTYPYAASRLGLNGKVELSFIIETNGLPSNIIVQKHLGGGCTEEAIKIIELIRWKPGIINGKAVRTLYKISINFKKGENKDGYIPNQQGTGI